MSPRVQAAFVAVCSFIAALASVLGGMLVVGCASAPKAAIRAEARAAVMMVGDALVEADHACASLALDRDDYDLAVGCAKAYDEGRASLIDVAKSVDAFDAGKARDVVCGVAYAADALDRMANLIVGSGGKTPPVIDDALLAAHKIGGCK